MHLADASQLKGIAGRAEGVSIRLENPLEVAQLQAWTRSAIPSLEYSDWTLENSNYFPGHSN